MSRKNLTSRSETCWGAVPLEEPRKRFELLDTLRGFAAIAIMVYHFEPIRPHFATYLAVDFFLILSGFILAHAYFSKPVFKFWSFVQARFARLYPLHLLTLLACVALYLVQGRYIDRSDLLLHGLMIHNIGLGPDSYVFNVPSWSISVEFWVNAIIGAAIAFGTVSLANRRTRLIALALTSAVSFAILVLTVGNLDATYQNIAPLINSGMLRGIASFCLGVLVFEAYASQTPAKMGPKQRTFLDIATLPLCLLFAVSMFSPIRLTLLDFAFVPFFACVVYAAAHARGAGAKLLSRYSYFGSISFAIYLIHRPVQYAYRHLLGGFDNLALYATLSLVTIFPLAMLIHHKFELPMNRFGRKALAEIGNQLKSRITKLRSRS